MCGLSHASPGATFMMSRNFTTNIFPLTLTSLSLCPQETGNTSTTPTVVISLSLNLIATLTILLLRIMDKSASLRTETTYCEDDEAFHNSL